MHLTPAVGSFTGIKEIGNIFKLSHIVFVNKEEAEKLTGFEVKSSVTKELLMALSGLGPQISVITDGGNGAYLFDGHKFLSCGIMPMDAYERTGAGDAFGSGFLSAIIKEKQWKRLWHGEQLIQPRLLDTFEHGKRTYKN